MLYPRIAYDIASKQRKAMFAQAATIGRGRAAQRALRGSRGGSASALMPRARISLRLRAA